MFGVIELLLLLFATGQVLSRDTDYCYAHNDQPYIKYATKTAYHFVHGGETPYQPIPHCKPVQMWMLIRHSARYPEPDVIERMVPLANLRDKIIENHEVRGYGRLCDADLDNLRNWRLDPAVKVEAALGPTEEGDKAMNLFGERIRKNFAELFPPVTSNVSFPIYEFRSAPHGEPMTSSKKAFKSGFLDGVSYPDAEIPENDTLFASYIDCPRRRYEVDNNPDVKVEVIRFTTGPEYQNLILNVSRRLGFLNNITVDIVHDMWDMCRYDKAWNITALSPWCAIFTEEELKVLEYKEDLDDYYKRGYGLDFNLRLGCPPMQHLFQHFEKLESENYSNEPKGVFTVGGSRTLHFFLTAMGIAKDTTPPLATDYPPTDKHRWKTSKIGTFGANIAAVFHKCNDTRSPNKVLFYQNEKILSYEGCSNGLCDWEFLKNKFPNASSPCNFDFCYQNSSVSIH